MIDFSEAKPEDYEKNGSGKIFLLLDIIMFNPIQNIE